MKGRALTVVTSYPTDAPHASTGAMVIGTQCYARDTLDLDVVIRVSAGTGTAYLIGWYKEGSGGRWASIGSVSLDSSLLNGTALIRATPGKAPTHYGVFVSGGPTVTDCYVWTVTIR